MLKHSLQPTVQPTAYSLDYRLHQAHKKMNSRQLLKLGVPRDCVKQAITAIQNLARDQTWKGKEVRQQIKSVLDEPAAFVADTHWGELAQALIEDRAFLRRGPCLIARGEKKVSIRSRTPRCGRRAACRWRLVLP